MSSSATASAPTNILELLNRCIEDGIESVQRDEMITRHPKRLEGSIEGFNLCRELRSPEEFKELIRSLGEECNTLRDAAAGEEYWVKRFCQVQVEWVYSVLCVGWKIYPLSGRAATYYARAVGATD